MHHSGHLQVRSTLNLNLCEQALHQSTGSNTGNSSCYDTKCITIYGAFKYVCTDYKGKEKKSVTVFTAGG